MVLDRKDIHIQEERQQSVLEIHNHNFPPHLFLPDLPLPTDIPDFLDGKEIDLRAVSSGVDSLAANSAIDSRSSNSAGDPCAANS